LPTLALRVLQALLDTLDKHERIIKPSWHNFGDSK
jgi:hypothetical protein